MVEQRGMSVWDLDGKKRGKSVKIMTGTTSTQAQIHNTDQTNTGHLPEYDDDLMEPLPNIVDKVVRDQHPNI